MYKKTAARLACLALAALLAACTSDYRNAIPQGSIALAYIDAPNLDTGESLDRQAKALTSLLRVKDISECGIDFAEKLFLFVDKDRRLGLVASIGSRDDVEQWAAELVEKNVVRAFGERGGHKFFLINNAFVAGFSSDALLIMGPALPAEQASLQQKMAKYLSADAPKDGNANPLAQRLDEATSPIALVARADALPEGIAAPLTLGAPSYTPPEQMAIASEMTIDNGCINITSETFSTNPDVDKALKEAASAFTPISGEYTGSASQDALLTVACGVEGEQCLRQLRSNNALRTLLFGLNTAIDIDKMMRTVSGDMLFAIFKGDDGKPDFQLIADAKSSDWTQDVPYWKRSCPQGAAISDWQEPNTYHFSSPDWNLFFGIADGKRLFFGSTEELASRAGEPAAEPLRPDIARTIAGKRLCVVLNLRDAIGQLDSTGTAASIAAPLLGDINTLVYSIK